MNRELVKWKVLCVVLLCAQALHAKTPTPMPKQKPVDILSQYSSKGDTTELSDCLAYISEHFTPKDTQVVNALLKAAKKAESRTGKAFQAHYVFGMYSILKQYYDATGNKFKSLEYALKIYKLLHNTRYADDLLWILVDIGNIFYSEKDYEQAMLFYKRAENIAVKSTDKYPLSVIYMNYGLVENNRGNYRKALGYYKTSCMYRQQSENIKVISNTYIKIANVFLKLNQPDSCMHYIRLAEDYFYNKGQETMILKDMPNYIDFTYAAYYAYHQNYDQAYQYIHKAQDYCLSNGITEEFIVDINTEAEYLVAQRKYKEAVDCMLRLMPYVKQKDMLAPQQAMYKNLGKYYAALGDYEKADAAMKRFMELDDSLDFTVLKSQLNMIRSISSVYERDAMLQQTKKNLHLAQLNNKASIRQRNASIIVIAFSVLIFSVLLLLFTDLRRWREKLLKLDRKITNQNNKISENSAELEATNQLKDKLFSIIAHDLRNPLNRILVELAIIKKSIAEKHLTAHMERTLKETIELFEGLLQWSKLDNKQNIYTPSRINMNDQINRVLTMYAPEINSRGIKVSKRTEPLFLFADPNIIQTLLRNLVSNGILFATKNEVNRTFEIELYDIGDNFAELKVSNSGPQFSAETIAEFYSQDEHIISSRTSLGLSICKLLARMCHWKIEIANHTDQEGIFLAIRIPHFRSKEPAKQKILDPSFSLPVQYIPQLMTIRPFRFYQVSHIRSALKPLETIKDESVGTWMENLKDAVHEGDEHAYGKLMEILDANAVQSIHVN